jgi:CheY-like chemotaxis protein
MECSYMQRPFRILIADRNPHVREFLRREFRYAGYRVQVAKDSQEVLMLIDVQEPPHLLILDLDMPGGDALELLERLVGREPPLPVVVHALLPEQAELSALDKAVALVEKRGETQTLKNVVQDVLRKYYPDYAFSMLDT